MRRGRIKLHLELTNNSGIIYAVPWVNAPFTISQLCILRPLNMTNKHTVSSSSLYQYKLKKINRMNCQSLKLLLKVPWYGISYYKLLRHYWWGINWHQQEWGHLLFHFHTFYLHTIYFTHPKVQHIDGHFWTTLIWFATGLSASTLVQLLCYWAVWSWNTLTDNFVK